MDKPHGGREQGTVGRAHTSGFTVRKYGGAAQSALPFFGKKIAVFFLARRLGKCHNNQKSPGKVLDARRRRRKMVENEPAGKAILPEPRSLKKQIPINSIN